MILPRALPVMSGTRHSTSVMRRSLSQRLSVLSCCSAGVCLGSFFLAMSGSMVCAFPAGRRERLEEAQVEGILGDPPLRVPLHRHQEGPGILVPCLFVPYRLHHPIGRRGRSEERRVGNGGSA